MGEETYAAVVWTIRAALLWSLLALGARRLSGQDVRWFSLARVLWTLGCLAYLAHVAAAFHFVHGWSHQAAIEHTARRTNELLGWSFGGGLFVNYVFTLIWVLDVAWWWLRAESYRRRSPAVDRFVIGFFLFMVVNGAVVFASGLVRVFTAALLGALLLLSLLTQKQSAVAEASSGIDFGTPAVSANDRRRSPQVRG